MPEPDLRFPIGEFHFPQTVSPAELNTFIDQIAETPAHVRAAVKGLEDAQLDTPYRPGGWSVRQLAHHIPDSHINSYVRYRLALTEDTPVIKPYEEQLWAELADARSLPIAPSLDLLESLHARWVPLLRSLSTADWSRSFRHPALGLVRLDQNAALYAWHGRHHVAHITALRKRTGW
jgi:hypothetical protein